jgi:hypothetical protein
MKLCVIYLLHMGYTTGWSFWSLPVVLLTSLLFLLFCPQELYHEFHALDRFEQDYRHKQKEQDGLSSRGDSLDILKQEVKGQSKHVKSLQKRSLWSKNLEEVGMRCLC